MELRLDRQNRLQNQDNPPEMTFVFGEEAFNRPIGGRDVMSGQLRYLLDLADHSAAALQVIPTAVGEHPGLGGSFNLLDIKETNEVLLFLESADGDFVSRDNQEMISWFIKIFEVIRGLALSPAETRGLISRRLDLLEESGSMS